jgi:hypothetical protein
MAELDPKKAVDQSDVIARCDRFEAEVAELRAAYEQYFLGLERRPPTTRHAEVRRHLIELKGMWVRQTAAKFRVQAAAQKYATYDRLWQRTLQEIEAGTYQRDLQRVKRKHPQKPPKPEQRESAPPPAAASGPAADAGAARAPSAPGGSVAPSAPALPPPRAASLGAARQGAGLSDQALRGVYDAYVQAKKRCNEDTSKLSFEQVAQMLRRQAPELMKKHQAQAIEFKVVIKDGKAQLRAVPKSG